MRKVMILSKAMARQFEGMTLQNISIYYFQHEIIELIRKSDIVLVYDEKMFVELKQRYSTETHRVFPINTLSAYLEYWS